MSGCAFPEHHKSGSGGGWLTVLAAAAVAAIVIKIVVTVVDFVIAYLWLIVTPPAVLIAVWTAYVVGRSAPRSLAACRNWPRTIWARIRWRWLVRGLDLARVDRHRRRVLRLRIPLTTAADQADTPRKFTRVRYPRAWFRPDVFGLVATVRAIPKTGRAEFEKNAQFIADAWRCHRVQISQPKPGRLVVRGLRTDPLMVPYPMADAPSEVFGNPGHKMPLQLYAGRDEWGADRYITLPGMTGIAVGGLPGYGKTSLIMSWLAQLAPSPAVQFVFIDGKGGGDYAPWRERAWIYTGDDLPSAAAAVEDVHALMRARLGQAEQTGQRNWWRTGPTELRPLIVTVIDECHTFFDLDAVKGSREAEAQVRASRSLAGQLVRKGRSVLFLTILITQKQTSDAIPTAIRDNCRVGVSFAVKTRGCLGRHAGRADSYLRVLLPDHLAGPSLCRCVHGLTPHRQ